MRLLNSIIFSFKSFTETGVKKNDDPSTRREIIFSNYIALILCAADLLLFLIPENRTLESLLETLIAISIFSVPVILNRLALVNLSRIYLSWMPPVLITWVVISGMVRAEYIPVSTYDGLHIYLLATSCIPYLLLNRKNILLFILGVLPNLLLLVFCDNLLEASDVGFSSKGGQDIGYYLTQTRSLIAYVVINGCCFSLKYIADNSDRLNQLLISELENKNQIIKEQAKHDVALLNIQLNENLRKLLKSNRELTLLNKINDSTSSAGSNEKLLHELCQVLIHEGGYKMVWIGQFPVYSTDHIVKPIVTLGDTTNYTKDLIIDFHNEEHRRGATVQALLNCKTTIISKSSGVIHYEIWHSQAMNHGFHSSVGICINADPITRYALHVYSGNPDSFDTDEISILERIANNVGSAIKSIHAANERDIARRELQKAYERMYYHVRNTPLAIIEMNKDFTIINWNKRAEELFEWKTQEVIGRKKYEFLVHEDDRELFKDVIKWMMDESVTANYLERKNITKSGKVLYCQWYYSLLRSEGGEVEAILATVSDVTEQKNTNYQLNKRIKELTTVHRVSELLNSESNNIHDLLQKIVEVLPMGWQYPEICEAKIVIAERSYTTSSYRESSFNQIAEFKVNNGLSGSVEVVYSALKPDEQEGPFLKEERDLIYIIAEMLQIYLEQNQKEKELQKSQANLSATINNTEIQIWSVDRNYKLLSFNKAFELFISENYNVHIIAGARVFESINISTVRSISEKWEKIYMRALTGEIFSVDDSYFGRDFTYSLSPIIERDFIIGVSVFGYDVTERNARDSALAEANKKIGELKVMALRSVMNPHFIFNVLNSIQFFIANNDRVNAINYLSTFSKLVRMVLTHSLADTISLKDELEMLKNYIQLEKVRFEDKFDFVFEIDNEVSQEDTRIPSLLIQPYIENAILHGLYGKQGRGRLIIRIKIEDEFLIIEIEDNGVGRKAAGKLKSQQQTLHKSMGTQLTEERLKLINDESGVAVSFTDLLDGLEPAGTCVRIKIKSY